MGLRGDTLIETAAGPKAIADLAGINAVEPDYSVPVVSWSGSKVFMVTARNFRCLGEEQISTVTLDDEAKLHLSASSALLLRRGDTKSPAELEEGDSLLPFYTATDRYGHRVYREPKKRQLIKFAKLVAEWKLGRPTEFGDYVELIDKDKANYHPNNLKIEHNKAKATKSRKYGIIETAKEIHEFLAEWAAIDPKTRKRIKDSKNHKVVSSELGLAEKVYTATIEGAEVVAVAGVFVKLSCYEA